MKLIIINGPNLNMLGRREQEIYGSESFEDFFVKMKEEYNSAELEYFQSNIEGELIDELHKASFLYDGVIINPGGYTHTSVALADAIAAIGKPTVEVHISNIYKREDYRHVSITGKNCAGIITGFGLEGYKMAVEWFLKILK